MYRDQSILVGRSDRADARLLPSMANRHGLIAGATGTGKTITLKVLAESFSDCGVPVFLADVKGDLAGMCRPGTANAKISERLAGMGLAEETFTFSSFPTCFWDVYGEQGLPLRTTVSEMGPLLLGRIMDLTDIQMDVLTIVFKIADDEGLLLIDTKDLKAMLQYVGEHAKEYSLEYGNMSKQSLGAVVRAVTALETEGGELFFGEPALDIADWIRTDREGKGVIQILDCRKLIQNPTMYATFLLWMLSELFETLPEVGDRDIPKMVFFFDEAHLLFDHAPKALLEKVEQVVKLIRSKGVGIYFITQNPRDIPDGVLAQLGNKIQHGLRAYTPKEQKAAKAVAQSFRENPDFDTYETLLALGTGEALVSMLDEKGIPEKVERCMILPPQSQMGALDGDVRQQEIRGNLLYSRYMEAEDRDSAYEFLQRMRLSEEEADRREAEEEAARKQREKERAAEEKQREKERMAEEKQQERERQAEEKQREKERIAEEKQQEKARLAEERQREREAEKARKTMEREAEAREKQVRSAMGRVASTAAGTLGREIGNELGKQFGGSFGKRLGGNVGASLGRGILSTLFKLK